jgi:hypothetical protein
LQDLGVVRTVAALRAKASPKADDEDDNIWDLIPF